MKAVRGVLGDDIKGVAKAIPAELKENKGLYTMEYVVAEKKGFLSKKKLQYSAKFRIDEAKKEVRFTEMLKDSSSGFSTGGGGFGDISSGFSFQKGTYKTGFGGNEGTIEEQAKLFGKDFQFTFDSARIRKMVEEAAVKAGYTFKYQITPIGP